MNRGKLVYTPNAHKRIVSKVNELMLRRYGTDSRVADILLVGSLAHGKFGAYMQPFDDQYGTRQTGSDVDIVMAVSYTGMLQDFRKDKTLHSSLMIKRRSTDDCVRDPYLFLDNTSQHLFIPTIHSIRGEVKHYVNGIVVTKTYFEELNSGVHDSEFRLPAAPWTEFVKDAVRIK